MRKKMLAMTLVAALLLNGCGWMGGSYISVTPHQEQRQTDLNKTINVSTFSELRTAMEDLISVGTESATIHVADYPSELLEESVERVIHYIMQDYPIGAYAVSQIDYELGTNMGKPAVALTVQYIHGRSELRRIQTVRNEEEVRQTIHTALEKLDPSVVLLEQSSASRDYIQMVREYARDNPQTVMEIPQLTETAYGSGWGRVVELVLTYQTERDTLRRMQTQVKPIFDSAALYVSGDDEPHQKYMLLYSFLMERFDYKLATSNTPTYSLLRHGVGDSRAFATVYSAMCRAAGLHCAVVTGTYQGEPYVWNMVCDSDVYYHVDLLRCSAAGSYREFLDADMADYVWDYSAFPACTGIHEATGQGSSEEPEEAAPTETTANPDDAPTEPTEEPHPTASTEPAAETVNPDATENTEDFEKSLDIF